jgi:hypothetical protein
MPRLGQFKYICAVPNQFGFGCCVGSITSHARVGLTLARVDNFVLAIGVNPLVFEGVTCNENDPWEWVVDFVNPTPAVVVDQALGSSNPKTSAAVNAARATVTSPLSLCDPPQPIAVAAATTAVTSDRPTNCKLVCKLVFM